MTICHTNLQDSMLMPELRSLFVSSCYDASDSPTSARYTLPSVDQLKTQNMQNANAHT